MRYAIACAGAVVTLAFAASAAYDTWHQRGQLYDASERELSNLSKVLAEETSRSIQTVDLLLRDTASWYTLRGHRLADEAVNAALSGLTAGVPQVAMLTLVDAQGRQRHRSHPTDDPLANVADRPYFQAQLARRDTGLFINEPVLTRSIGEHGLVMSRRVDDSSGRFMGVVTAIVTLDHLRRSYGRIDFGSHTELHVVFNDGTPVISLPRGIQPSHALSPQGLGLQLRDGESRQVRRMLEGRPKILAAADIQDQPLFIALLRDEAEVLTAWSTEARNSLLRTLALAACAALAVWAGIRQLRRIEAHEQALAQSEARYALAMEAADEGHAEWDIVTDTVYLSPRWCDMHLWPVDACVHFSDLREMRHLHQDDRLALRAMLDGHLRGDTPSLDTEYRVALPDGQWRWIHARGRVRRDPGGNATRFYWTTTDVSHRKRAEEERARLETRLRSARHLESLGTMAGGIAHDFNNILGAILGYGEMAQRALPPASAATRHLDRVMQAGLRAKALVRRIIDFSRSSYGEKLPVAVQSVVDEALQLLMPTLTGNIRLDIRLGASNATVLGEASQLHQVVMNLCTNAIQAMGHEGLVSVTLDTSELARELALTHGLLQPGRYVRLTVRDTGRGMDARVYERMFDPFFTTRAVGEGAGLGLSVTHGIVNDLGGAIDVHSTPGKGTVFTVWLPWHGERQETTTDAERPLPQGHGEVVMVVDDEPALVELLEDTLAALGYEPVGFASADQALVAFHEAPGRFDLVLTDEQLPGMTGTELIARVRLLRPSLPAIVVTGHGGEGLETRAQSVGVNAVLTKPLLAADLATGIASVLH